jgi:hypothetical protein
MLRTETDPLEWHVAPDGPIPAEVAAAAERGRPIVAHLRGDLAIDGWVAELLEECASVVRYGA